MTSPNELAALATLNEDKAKALLTFYHICRDFSRMDEAELKTCGHKSKEAALLYETQAMVKRITKMDDDFTKKFPD